jgi:CheY-like chemotaxis protein
MLPEKNLHSAIRGDQRGTESDEASREGANKGGDRAIGSSHLTKRSDLANSRARHELPHDILIVDDEALDAERLTATLRVLYGYQVSIRWACSIGDALDGLAEKQPCLTFLDDILKPSADAFLSIPELRRAGYEGPIIVVSGAVTQSRRTRLIAGGATDVIHKDDVDSVRVAEAVDRARADQPKRRG